jgi:hypothetical protein
MHAGEFDRPQVQMATFFGKRPKQGLHWWLVLSSRAANKAPSVLCDVIRVVAGAHGQKEHSLSQHCLFSVV